MRQPEPITLAEGMFRLKGDWYTLWAEIWLRLSEMTGTRFTLRVSEALAERAYANYLNERLMREETKP